MTFMEAWIGIWIGGALLILFTRNLPFRLVLLPFRLLTLVPPPLFRCRWRGRRVAAGARVQGRRQRRRLRSRCPRQKGALTSPWSSFRIHIARRSIVGVIILIIRSRTLLDRSLLRLPLPLPLPLPHPRLLLHPHRLPRERQTNR